jgi:hypothetical protein
VTVTKSELRGWVQRFDVAEQRSKRARVLRPLSPDESFAKALDLVRLADECGMHKNNPNPSDEDLEVMATWNRLRRAVGMPHGSQ